MYKVTASRSLLLTAVLLAALLLNSSLNVCKVHASKWEVRAVAGFRYSPKETVVIWIEVLYNGARNSSCNVYIRVFYPDGTVYISSLKASLIDTGLYRAQFDAGSKYGTYLVDVYAKLKGSSGVEKTVATTITHFMVSESFEDLRSDVEYVRNKVDAISDKLNAIDDKLDNLSDKVYHYYTDLKDAMTNYYADIMDQFHQLSIQIDDLKENVTAEIHELEINLKAYIDEKTNEIITEIDNWGLQIETRVNETSKEIFTKIEQLNISLSMKLDNISMTLADYYAQIFTLIMEMNSTIYEMYGRCEHVDQMLSDIYDELYANIENLTEALISIENSVMEVKEYVKAHLGVYYDDLVLRMEETKISLNDLRDDVDELKRENKLLTGNVTELLTGKIAALQENIRDLKNLIENSKIVITPSMIDRVTVAMIAAVLAMIFSACTLFLMFRSRLVKVKG